MISEKILELEEAREAILIPTFERASRVSGEDRVDGTLAKFMESIDENPENVKMAMIVMIDIVNDFHETIQGIKKLISKNTPINESLLNHVLDDISGTYNNMLDVVIEKFIPNQKEINRTLIKTGIFESTKIIEQNDGILKLLKSTPNDISDGLLSGFLRGSTNHSLLNGFVGNPLYFIGKYFVRQKKLNRDRLILKRDYLNHELTELELGVEVKDSKQIKKHYIDEIRSLDLEIKDITNS